jgi:hypothetical protein
MEGTVQHRCDAKPKDTPQYRLICRKRKEIANTKTRQAQIVDAKQVENESSVKLPNEFKVMLQIFFFFSIFLRC